MPQASVQNNIDLIVAKYSLHVWEDRITGVRRAGVKGKETDIITMDIGGGNPLYLRHCDTKHGWINTADGVMVLSDEAVAKTSGYTVPLLPRLVLGKKHKGAKYSGNPNDVQKQLTLDMVQPGEWVGICMPQDGKAMELRMFEVMGYHRGENFGSKRHRVQLRSTDGYDYEAHCTTNVFVDKNLWRDVVKTGRAGCKHCRELRREVSKCFTGTEPYKQRRDALLAAMGDTANSPFTMDPTATTMISQTVQESWYRVPPIAFRLKPTPKPLSNRRVPELGLALGSLASLGKAFHKAIVEAAKFTKLLGILQEKIDADSDKASNVQRLKAWFAAKSQRKTGT